MLISDDTVMCFMRWSVCGSRCFFQNELLKALAHASKKMIAKVYLRRDYLVCAVLQVLYFSSILFRDEESFC